MVELALKYFVDAEIHLSESLETPDAWVDSNRAVLEKSRAKVRANLGQVLCSDCPPGTTIEAPGRPATGISAQGGVWLDPGSLVLKFSAPGRSSTEKAVIVVAGKDVRVSSGIAFPIRMVPASGQAPPVGESAAKASNNTASGPSARSQTRGDDNGLASVTSANSLPRLVGIVATGAGVVASGAGVLVYRAGRNKHDAIASDAANDRRYNPANSNYQTLANIGAAMMIVGSAAIVTGAVLYLFNRDDASERGTTGRVDVSLAPALTSAVGGIVQIGGTF